MVSYSSNKMNQPQSPKRKKKNRNFFFGRTPYAKNGFHKKKSQNFFRPRLPILDAAAKSLLIINSKHPTQELGYRESLEFI